MTSAFKFENYLGEWPGTNKLWLSPKEEAHKSKSTALVAVIAQGQFITISHTWAFEDEPQD